MGIVDMEPRCGSNRCRWIVHLNPSQVGGNLGPRKVWRVSRGFVSKSIGTPMPCDHVDFPTRKLFNLLFLPTMTVSTGKLPVPLLPPDITNSSIPGPELLRLASHMATTSTAVTTMTATANTSTTTSTTTTAGSATLTPSVSTPPNCAQNPDQTPAPMFANRVDTTSSDRDNPMMPISDSGQGKSPLPTSASSHPQFFHHETNVRLHQPLTTLTAAAPPQICLVVQTLHGSTLPLSRTHTDHVV